MLTQVVEWLSVKEFLERHRGRIGRNSVYDRIKDKSLPSVRLGRRVLIPADALERLLAQAGGGAQGQDSE